MSGSYAYCSREEHAGGLPRTEGTTPPTWRHWLGSGDCRCGRRHPGNERPQAARQAGPRQARDRTWEIRHADGVLFSTHHRIDFVDGSRRTWWPKGTRVREAPLYRSDTLANVGPDELVIVAEGEPDTDALAEAGIPAVGTVCGAEMQPPDSALGALRGRRVALWPDADDASTTPPFVGQQHMDGIARRLAGAAKEVLLIDWAEAPAKGGARDFVERHGPDALQALVAAARPYPADGIATPPRELDRHFQHSALMRPKWDERHHSDGRTYGQATIANALGLVTESYRGASDGALPWSGSLIDWRTFWSRDHTAEDWLIEPLLPRGRSVVIYSPAKAGKSLLALDLAARLATGRRVLDQPAGAPVRVVYLDLEMTEGDLYERLTEMGYGPDDDLSALSYYMLPSLPPLDTPEGGAALISIARGHNAELSIIDTTSRVLSGAENDSDSIRAFYLNTGLPLKAEGRTVLRLDHAGKDPTKGQRGTSAKADDVDVVWELTTLDGSAVRLRATHRRQAWVPERVDLVRIADPLRHERALEAWPAGTADAAILLDQLGIPFDHGARRVRAALRGAGHAVRNDVIAAAIRFRRAAESSGTRPAHGPGTRNGDTSALRFGDTSRDTSGHVPADDGAHVSP